jgi:LPPG:FO 2-phospho-L-lactate transferase
MIAVLCGGIGGSRFLRALSMVLPPQDITAIVNVGDDDEFHGLYVSPDLDIITYALAGEVDEDRGWGLRHDTFRWLDSLRRFGRETWFQIGDRDLATHLHRTRLLGEGWPLSRIADHIARAFGLRQRLLPASDDRLRTTVATDGGDLRFQEFLVKHRAAPLVRDVRFAGAASARPAPGVIEALESATAIFIAPSNPVGSIGAVLSVPGVRDAISRSPVRKVAVSPIIGGRSLQPPAGEMLSGLGHQVSAAGVALMYRGLVDTLIIDQEDAAIARSVDDAGLRAVVAETVMRDDRKRRTLAMAALRAAGIG